MVNFNSIYECNSILGTFMYSLEVEMSLIDVIFQFIYLFMYLWHFPLSYVPISPSILFHVSLHEFLYKDSFSCSHLFFRQSSFIQFYPPTHQQTNTMSEIFLAFFGIFLAVFTYFLPNYFKQPKKQQQESKGKQKYITVK